MTTLVNIYNVIGLEIYVLIFNLILVLLLIIVDVIILIVFVAVDVHVLLIPLIAQLVGLPLIVKSDIKLIIIYPSAVMVFVLVKCIS